VNDYIEQPIMNDGNGAIGVSGTGVGIDARSLRGEGGELSNLKTLSYGFTTFAQSKTRTSI
jgi:hypothetical protein